MKALPAPQARGMAAAAQTTEKVATPLTEAQVACLKAARNGGGVAQDRDVGHHKTVQSLLVRGLLVRGTVGLALTGEGVAALAATSG